MTGFLALELRRSLRDVRYLILAVAMPVGLYLLFAGLFGARGQRAQGLPQPVELMVAMIAYGAMWAVFSATGWGSPWARWPWAPNRPVNSRYSPIGIATAMTR